MSLNTRYRNLIEQAACRDAEPHLFDMTDLYMAQTAISYCRICPVVQLCQLELDPANNFYDGVAGGFVWKDGKIIKPKKNRPKETAA